MRSYAEQKAPGRSAVGFAVVVALHAVLIWALMNGLGHKMIDVIKGPLVTKIIAAPKPPPDKTPPPPPPDLVKPPPPYIPTPQINVETPSDSNAITAPTTSGPPPAAAPPPPPVADVDVSERPISSTKPVYPPSLVDDEVEGYADVECDVDTTGHTSNCKVDEVSGSSLFGASALAFARSSIYSPATHNGVPVMGHHRWRVRFKLD